MSVAKCHNYTGCLLAYRGEEIQLKPGEPMICRECGKPLTPVSGGSARVAKWIGLIVLVLLVIAGAVAAMVLMKRAGETKQATPTPQVLGTEQPTTTATTTTQPTTSTPESAIPEKATVVKDPDTNLQNERNRRVREDVLKRIDLIPNITPANKDKLYNSVQRARGMGMILQIPFASGRKELSSAEIQALKTALDDPAIVRLRDDPTAVFVVLGYADKQGDEQKNISVSQARADSVVNAMQKVAGVVNVTHAVGMGGSTLHDSQSADPNRVVEVWAVLP